MLTFNSSAVNSSVSFSIDWATAPLTGTNPAPRPVAKVSAGALSTTIVMRNDQRIEQAVADLSKTYAAPSAVKALKPAKISDRRCRAILEADFPFLGLLTPGQVRSVSRRANKFLKLDGFAEHAIRLVHGEDTTFSDLVVLRGHGASRFANAAYACVVKALKGMMHKLMVDKFVGSENDAPAWMDVDAFYKVIQAHTLIPQARRNKMKDAFVGWSRVAGDSIPEVHAVFCNKTGYVHDGDAAMTLLKAIVK
jgi:hypothetical protein